MEKRGLFTKGMKDLIIRKIRPSDFEPVLTLLEANIPRYFAESELEDFRTYLQSELEEYFLLELKNRLIGAGGINYHKASQMAFFSWDFLHPAYHGKGYGRQLCEHRLQVLRSKSINQVEVRTSQLAADFYRKMGFQLVETKANFWAKGFDLYHMKQILS